MEDAHIHCSKCEQCQNRRPRSRDCPQSFNRVWSKVSIQTLQIFTTTKSKLDAPNLHTHHQSSSSHGITELWLVFFSRPEFPRLTQHPSLLRGPSPTHLRADWRLNTTGNAPSWLDLIQLHTDLIKTAYSGSGLRNAIRSANRRLHPPMVRALSRTRPFVEIEKRRSH